MELNHYEIFSVFPPIFALITAIWKKQIYLSLLVGIWLGCLILKNWNPLIATTATIDSIINVFSSSSNTKIIFYSLGVGSILNLLNSSGGIKAFINWIEKKNFVRNPFQAQLIPFLIGIFITIESSITALISGTVGKPLTDKHKICKEKLAYICDSTSAPICILFPFNGWGAFIIGLLIVQQVDNPVLLLFSSIKYNFYPLVTILILFISIYFNWNIGPMKAAQKKHISKTKFITKKSNKSFDNFINENDIIIKNSSVNKFIIPIVSMIFLMILSLFLTGLTNSPNDITLDFWKVLSNSEGSTSVLWSVIGTIISIGFLNKELIKDGVFFDLILKGMAKMFPVVTLLLLAFSMGEIIHELGTGIYISNLIPSFLNEKIIVISLFLTSCLIAFSTGSSWGTFAIMVPISITISHNFIDAQVIFLASVLGGGIFGDHCSPISDTTIISSMAAGSNHIDHVRTQLPYALISAFISIILYIIV